jgi:hypothetical protein
LLLPPAIATSSRSNVRRATVAAPDHARSLKGHEPPALS